MINHKNTTYHFIGIKGSGMSSLALVLHEKGFKVQGSDVEEYFFTQRDLEKAGIPLMVFSPENITEGLTIIAGNALSLLIIHSFFDSSSFFHCFEVITKASSNDNF